MCAYSISILYHLRITHIVQLNHFYMYFSIYVEQYIYIYLYIRMSLYIFRYEDELWGWKMVVHAEMKMLISMAWLPWYPMSTIIDARHCAYIYALYLARKLISPHSWRYVSFCRIPFAHTHTHICRICVHAHHIYMYIYDSILQSTRPFLKRVNSPETFSLAAHTHTHWRRPAKKGSRVDNRYIGGGWFAYIYLYFVMP